MTKLILILLLVGMSSNVLAEWTKFTTHFSNKNVTIYVDMTLKTKGKKVKMWDLYDYTTPQGDPGESRFLSVAHRFEYDCEELTIRKLVFATYSGNMMGGDVINYFDTTKWSKPETIIEGTLNYRLFNSACSEN
jgi:hypothetical protein